MNELSIIIVSWNCKDYLRRCLESISKFPPGCSYDIILIDNASSDGTVEMVQTSFPGIKLIINDSNRGFAAANNVALKHFISQFYLLLNPDTEVYDNSIQSLIDIAKRNTEVWGIGPAIINGDGSPQRTGVRFPNNWNIFSESLFLDKLFPHSKLFGRHRQLYHNPNIERELDYVKGSCILLHNEAIKKIGFLDEDYFMYFEETDWCYRVRKAGKCILYSPLATIKHYGGGEFGHFDKHKIIHYHKSLLLFYHKHYSALRSFTLRNILIIRSLIRLCIWSIIFILQPSMRKRAASACRGYYDTLFIMLSRTS